MGDATAESPEIEQGLAIALDSLRNSLENHNAVLIVGPQALTVKLPAESGEAREVSFYRLVAERLLERFGLALDVLDEPGRTWDLHRACALVMQDKGISSKRLKPIVANLLRDLGSQVEPAGALAALGQLTCFDLIVCLTPDDLVARALGIGQPGLSLDLASYSPTAPSSQRVDIGAARPDELRLCYPLGSLEAGGDFAIHEEDTLEYLHRLYDQGERRLKTLLTELRGKDRIFLGTSLPDWLGRGLMRFVNDQRLATEDRTIEFLSGVDGDPALAVFIRQFSSISTVVPWSAGEFVAQIAAITAQLPPRVQPRARPQAGLQAAAGQGPTAFVSYASEDAECARRIADTLLELGFGDVWLDRKKLKTGDHWSDDIDAAIAGCDYFVPILSARADARNEGVFWEEWRQALARSLRVKRAFILPIGIDDEFPSPQLYPSIFSGDTLAFNKVNLLHAPRGDLGRDERDQMRRRVEEHQDPQRG